MQRITISVPDELAARLRRQARACRKSLSEVVRDALDEDASKPQRREVSFVGIVSSEGVSPAEDVHGELAKTWAADIRKGWRG